MSTRGAFIVIEGIDGSGKRTQLELLARAFDNKPLPYARVSFPNYEGFFGKLVARFLNGDFGPLEAVDPHFSALLYAGDRYESKPAMEAALAAGKNLLSDRYIGSNLAHQGARLAPEKRAEFLEWLRNLEYKIYGLPAEDTVIYLHVPVEEADRLIGKRAKRHYTDLRRDLQEADRRHLEAAAEVYEELARQPNWVRIDCADATGALRAPAVIHAEVVAAVQTKICGRAGGGRVKDDSSTAEPG
jgi:dTMP kinase